MKKIYKLMLIVGIALTSVWRIQAQMPQPSGTTEHWYMIHDNRSPVNYWEIQNIYSITQCLGLSKNNVAAGTKLFKLVESASGEYKIYSFLDTTNPVSSASSAGNTKISISATNTYNVWTLLQSTVVTTHYRIVTKTDSKQLNSYSGSAPPYVSFWTPTSDNDMGNRWQFVEVTVDGLKSALQAKITEAQNRYDTTTEGTSEGQFPASARSTFQTAINTAQTTYNNATSITNELLNATATLNTAILTYNQSEVSRYCVAQLSGDVISDNSRAWNTTTFTVLDAPTVYDAKIGGTGTIAAGALYRGVQNSSAALNIYQNRSMSIAVAGSMNWIHIAIYADWNGDGVFDPVTEKIARKPDNTSGTWESPRVITFTVPTSSQLGETRIRVIFGWLGQDTDANAEAYFSPCKIVGQSSEGTLTPKNARIYDYLVNVKTESAAINPPTFSAVTGSVIVKNDNVTLTSGTGTTMKYTTDGSEPATSSTVTTTSSNTATVTIANNMTIKAVTVSGGVNSDVSTAVYKIIPIALNTSYHILFQRPDRTLALADMGDAAKLHTATLAWTDAAQKWTVTKGTTDGVYVLTSGNGHKVYYNTTDSRYYSAVTPAATSDMRIITSPNTTYPNSFEIQRIASTGNAMNPFGGSVVGNEIGEYTVGDGGNPLVLVTPKDELLARIAVANGKHTNAPEGTDFGQYSSTAKANLQTAINSAQGVYDNASADETTIINAINDLNTAITTFNGQQNTNLASLLSTNPLKHRWYWIQNKATATYAADKVMSQGARNVGDKFTYEDKAASINNNQLFRFELNTDQTAISNIINKTGTYLAQDGVVGADAAANTGTFTMIALDGISFNIKPSSVAAIHAQQSGALIVNWAAGAGSASAWVLNYAMEDDMTTNTHSIKGTNYIIRSVNKIITVDGVENFDVYTVSGQKVNAKAALQNGVYIVKVKDFTQKVIVK